MLEDYISPDALEKRFTKLELEIIVLTCAIFIFLVFATIVFCFRHTLLFAIARNTRNLKDHVHNSWFNYRMERNRQAGRQFESNAPVAEWREIERKQKAEVARQKANAEKIRADAARSGTFTGIRSI
ncbi:hypothetical protein B9Z55_026431 [Caenorhabditis nigoni]|uniref:Uncharacterized protein n=1 Tax=Caenorhabditis nigoni TaxID=1611254 RepID=A0A2G5T322_9PELO|nr:hypothetical protein B9Z55_026431 [Caenorhabditis nigoni]